MRKATLLRLSSSDEGTFGELRTAGGFCCFSVELPWRNNQTGLSCIPEGVYIFRMVDSPKHGRCYEVWDDPRTPEREDVVGRDHIQIHSANWAGDESKGYKCQLLGCIALGKTIESIPYGPGLSQKGVTSSRQTVEEFVRSMNGEPFELAVMCGPGVGPMNVVKEEK